METYIKISYLNDFIFCPRSIYFHELYGDKERRIYQSSVQLDGLAAHSCIDKATYSTACTILQGISVYSHQYNLGGKIDVFDIKKGLLTERKKKIKKIYDGYIFQLYAQYFCLKDMGYSINKLKLYSMDDNKNYFLKKPEAEPEMFEQFLSLLEQIRNFNLSSSSQGNLDKCRNCIYAPMCDISLC